MLSTSAHFYYREISDHLQLEMKELRRTLQSVLDVKLLVKESNDVCCKTKFRS